MVHYSLSFTAYKAASGGGFPSMQDFEPWLQLQLLALRKNGLHTYSYISLKIVIFKFKRDICYFLWFFIFIIVRCIWKVCLLGNILSFKIIALTKE